MTAYGWETGTIKLPSAEFSRLRKAVETADRKAKEQSFEQAQAFWKGLTRKQQTDPEAYSAALNEYSSATYADLTRRQERLGWGAPAPERNRLAAKQQILSDTLDKLRQVAAGGYDPQTRAYVPGKPRRVQVTDMDYPTNRTTSWRVANEGSITFDRETSSVRWATGHNNHQVERAHADPLAQTLFAELGKVHWTRGTGGTLMGNDEYNEDAGRETVGMGGSYITSGFGPIGGADPEAFMRTQPYRDSTGELVRAVDFPGKKAFERQLRATRAASPARGGAGTGRVPAGVRTGGQFTTRGRGESSARL